MIKKEFEEVKSTDKFSQAGAAAEKQMAFYLKRDFGDTPKMLILNSIRLNFNDDPAQIDHLVIHKYGIIIIESKSVSTEVIVNERGEWIRRYNKRDQGMPSPVEQAKRQVNYLRKYLKLYGPKLPSGLLIQRTYDEMPIDVVVAISDDGIIKAAKGIQLDNVCKAEVVYDKVHKIINGYKEKVLPSPFTMDYKIGEAICTFLIEAHTPLEKMPSKTMEPKSTSAVESQQLKGPSFRCGKCRGKNIAIVSGPYGYYFKCRDCDHNTPIKQICESCKSIMKIRKERNRFFAECKGCGTSNHIFTNPT